LHLAVGVLGTILGQQATLGKATSIEDVRVRSRLRYFLAHFPLIKFFQVPNPHAGYRTEELAVQIGVWLGTLKELPFLLFCSLNATSASCVPTD
jgi:hypothetical protein